MEQQFSSASSFNDSPPPLQPGLGRRSFSVGAALGQGFGTFFKNLPAFLLIGMVILAPLYLYGYTRDPEATSLADMQRSTMIVVYGAWALQLLITAAVSFGVIEQMAGRRASVGRCLSVGLRTMIPAILYLVVLFFGAALFGLAGGLIVVVLAAIAPALGVVGIIGLAVVFMMFFTALFVAVPALAIERQGVFDSIGRSQDLTRGRRWQVFAVWFVTFLVGLALAWVLGFVLASAGAVTTSSWRAMIALQLVAQTVTAVLSSTVCATVYVLLRKDADGTDVEELSKVFD